MQKLTKIYLIKWKSRPRGHSESKIYIRRAYAQSFFVGIRMGAKDSSINAFEVGQTVKLTDAAWNSCACPRGRGNNKTAVILNLDRKNLGGVFLSRDLHGTRHWNVEDLLPN